MTVHLWPEVKQAQKLQTWFNVDDRRIVEELGFILKNYPQDTVVQRRTLEEDKVFLVRSGWGCLYSHLPDGDRQITDFPMRGDIVIPRDHRDDSGETLCAHTALVLLEAPVSSLFAGLARSPPLCTAFWAAIRRQRAILAQHLVSVGCRRAIARVAHLLLELAVRLEQTGEITRYEFRCPLTQYDFADALGLTTIHINRVLRELRERGLVEFRYGSVRFLNRPGLERLADFDGAYLA
ncbi:Crp/Fnr family transcriptional regulator [Chelativorans intermedius]|uniref:Crp/Fnr family transcriptional regulator n=1 Tax=Chelativorans intermedius TaxID=515947 RepID=A0ABV6D6B9_9HYPH|nr:Crp/Fnr family transcriptional regulator [Chelativorans intermedius]MCT8999396.1 Crp/Fnr family transcriptional regulator [Chelativorans intermedius]